MTAVPAPGTAGVPEDPTPWHDALTSQGGLDVLTADGAIVRIRQVCADDAVALTELHERASDDTLYRRFLSAGHHPIAAEVARLVRPSDSEHAALVAVERGRVVGVCSYEVLPDRSEAEFAVFVDDNCHDRGIGTLLLEHLGVWGRRHGIPNLLGEVLPSNSPMLRVAAGIGQPMRSKFDLGLIEVRLNTAVADTDILDLRDLAAARHSLGSLFAPRCVAVISAGAAGHIVARAIVDGGFTGTVYEVAPNNETIGGVPVYPSIAAAPIAPDLVIISVGATVGATAVATAVAEAAAGGARIAAVFGAPGRAHHAELVRLARAGGMRLVGPNCLGILNTDPAVRLYAAPAVSTRPGGLAIASQSGPAGISLLEEAGRAGIGIATFVSLGDKADVSGNDLLSYWYDDPAAKVVALYLESLGNPRRFARIARAVARRKPVLVVKGGGGTASDATVDALFAQAGVIRCDGLREMLEIARVFIDESAGVDRHAPVDGLREEAGGALGRAAQYQQWRRTPLGHRPELAGIDAARARRLVSRQLTADAAGRSSTVAADLLGCYGIAITHPSKAPRGVELVAGIAHDPLFGSVVTCGLPGIAPDLVGDRALRLLPVTDHDAAQMWRQLTAAPLLTGDRGAAPVDTTALEDMLLRLGRLAEDLPEVAELDLNPVIVNAIGIVVAGATVRLAPIGSEPDSGLRGLREPA